MTPPTRNRALAALALASALLAPAGAAVQVVEAEPNDDAGAGDYAGALTLPAGPFLLDVAGTLADGADLDAYRLDGIDPGPTVVLLTGLDASATLAAQHVPVRPGDGNAAATGHGSRLVAGWTIAGPEEERTAFLALAFSAASAPDDYRLRLSRPGPAPEKATLAAVFKADAGADSFKAKIRYEDEGAPVPGGPGDIVVAFRDYEESLPAASFVPNAAGTVFKYASSAPGVRKVIWNTRSRWVTVQGKGIDFAAEPANGHLMAAVLSEGGACGAAATGTLKGTTTKRVVAKVK
jgi:hypothetical protein